MHANLTNFFIHGWAFRNAFHFEFSCSDFVTYRLNKKFDLNWMETKANDMQMEAITCVKY